MSKKFKPKIIIKMKTSKTYTIDELQAKIQIETNKYKLDSLKEKLSWLKAEEKGQFIVKEDLIEYKPLIIWITNRALFFKSKENLKAVMTEMLNRIENGKVVYRTKRGIKGILTEMAKEISLDICCSQIYDNNPELALNSNLRQTDKTYQNFQSFRLNVNMGSL